MEADMDCKYREMPDHDILVIVAETSDRQERHLEKINSTLSSHDKRIMKMELRREVEEDLGVNPPSRKKKAVEGSMYGGLGALIVGVLYTLGHLVGWW